MHRTLLILTFNEYITNCIILELHFSQLKNAFFEYDWIVMHLKACFDWQPIQIDGQKLKSLNHFKQQKSATISISYYNGEYMTTFTCFSKCIRDFI